MWVGKLGEGSGSTHVWLKPLVKLPEEDDAGIVVPAWFVDQTKDPNIANMTISWKERYGIHVPVMSNTIALKPGDRLYRLIKGKKGTAPPSVLKFLAKQDQKEQEEKEKKEEKEKETEKEKEKAKKPKEAEPGTGGKGGARQAGGQGMSAKRRRVAAPAKSS